MALDEPDRWHRDLLWEVLELGEDFGLELVLGAFGGFAIERPSDRGGGATTLRRLRGLGGGRRASRRSAAPGA